jgi:hypothetical protein
MELVATYLFERYIGKQDPMPFPEYLLPQNKYKKDFWVTQQGECVYPWEMETRHLLNTIRLIHRNNPAFVNRYIEANADEHIIYGKAPWATNSGKKKKGNASMSMYFMLWDSKPLYMLLRREIKLRGLEEHL